MLAARARAGRFRRVRRWSSTALGAALLCVLAAAPAPAAFKRAPIELGPGDGKSPSVVVDAAGTAHVAWGIAEELIGYCALPRGARACTRSARLALDARAGRPVLMQRPQDGLLVLVAGRDDAREDPDESVWAFTSADGATWSPPAPIGLGLGEIDAAVLTADGQAVDLLEARDDGNLFQRAPLAGPPAAAVLDLSSTPAGARTGFNFPGDMVRTAGGATLAFLGSPADGFAYRMLRAGDPLADASWRPWPARRVTREWDEPRAAAGPARRVRDVRQRTSSTRSAGGAAARAQAAQGPLRAPARAVLRGRRRDQRRRARAGRKGRLHAAMVGDANPGDRACIAYARTSGGAGSRARCRCTRRSRPRPSRAACASPSLPPAAAWWRGRRAARPRSPASSA